MSSHSRITLAVVLGTVLIVAGFAAAGAAAYYLTGNVEIAVHDADGDDVRLSVPAAIVHVALDLVPFGDLHGLPAELHRFGPVMETLARQLDKMPDAVLVEVEQDGEHVRVEKRHGEIRIDVVGREENVHISAPLGLVRKVLAKVRRLPAMRPQEV